MITAQKQRNKKQHNEHERLSKRRPPEKPVRQKKA